MSFASLPVSPECIGTCKSLLLDRKIFASGLKGDSDKNSSSAFDRLVVDPFRNYCQGAEFLAYCTIEGLSQPSFQWNQHAIRTDSSVAHQDGASERKQSLYDRFIAACATVGSHSLTTGARSVALVFHGTSESNIEKILQEGLDPALRRGQAYGVGEYFSKVPGVSTDYCKGGKRMLVFMVILPPEQQNTTGGSYTYGKPLDYVVVRETSHQLPVGVISFESVEHAVLSRSRMMRSKLQELNRQAVLKAMSAEEASTKAKIIQFLICGETEMASNCYKKSSSRLSVMSQKEIAMYAYKQLDEEFVMYYFSDLPPPMKANERDVLEIKTVEEEQKDAAEALQKLQEQQDQEQKNQERQEQQQVARPQLVQPPRSPTRRLQHAQLRREQEKKRKQDVPQDEASLTAAIIQLIIQGEIEEAGHKYTKAPQLSDVSKGEIAMYARRRQLDEGFIMHYFPGLPVAAASAQKYS